MTRQRLVGSEGIRFRKEQRRIFRREVRVGQEGQEIGRAKTASIDPPEEPRQTVYGYNKYMAHHYAYMTKVAEVHEPESYAEAAKDAN